ncbi:DNA-binding response OmpR family regulator [Salsuginibacillus halophilus]|uniref:DNA-binding response OmpR family regulator n=1 Tax=Salsuginibacillus halophilus TaxID=517424 RepID=A0A2P8H9S7_9BACI|nr:response regulator transcription factor [Salsuginibacillus halophilus]PSL42975.1 DNA-binding response OmpR family regulator [Salsuginibacillus halophilus]
MHILVVEDDRDIALIVKEHLGDIGYQVTWASTGTEGLEEVSRRAFDLVLVDLMLPEMDGFDLCHHIRMKSSVPLLIISAKSSDKDKVKGLELGADDYLTKPFSLKELEARVHSHIRRYHQYQPELSADEMAFEGLVIQKSAQRVFTEEEVVLTAKEFELLLLLASNPGRTFTKAEIYEHVWQQSSGIDEHTVTVHIRKLWTKLNDPAKSPKWLETAWGTGYRFIGTPV